MAVELATDRTITARVSAAGVLRLRRMLLCDVMPAACHLCVHETRFGTAPSPPGLDRFWKRI